MILYLSLAVTAAMQNRSDAAKSSVRLQNLTSPTTSTSSTPMPTLPTPTSTPDTTGRHTPTGGSRPISNLQPYPADHPLSQTEARIGLSISKGGRVESRVRRVSEDEEAGLGLGQEQRVWTPLPRATQDVGHVFAVGDGEVDGKDDEKDEETQARKDSKN
tara:strand:+ start:4912 stop:5391 length:480 start_codon:yes stop_codon:yes gene_type:complete